MTVHQMITVLKQMPPRAKICLVSHDQDPYGGEFDGEPRNIMEAPEALRERGFQVVISQ